MGRQAWKPGLIYGKLLPEVLSFENVQKIRKTGIILQNKLSAETINFCVKLIDAIYDLREICSKERFSRTVMSPDC